MKKEARNRTWILVAYSLWMIGMIAIIAGVKTQPTLSTVTTSPSTEKEMQKEVEFVYMEIPSVAAPEKKEEGWILKETDQRIGIFSKDHVLLYTVDVYIKTLPKADQSLLREGIAVSSRSALYALLEDYGA